MAVLVAGGVVKLVKKRSDRTAALADDQKAIVANDVNDLADVIDYFFDTPPNPRTRTPGKKGWTTQVNEQLSEHGTLLLDIRDKLDVVVGDAASARKAAENEVIAQRTERERVQRRDADHGG